MMYRTSLVTTPAWFGCPADSEQAPASTTCGPGPRPRRHTTPGPYGQARMRPARCPTGPVGALQVSWVRLIGRTRRTMGAGRRAW